MPVLDSVPVWDALAVSSTTTYNSKVSTPSLSLGLSYTFTKTGTATGTLKWQVNNLSDLAYNRAVNAASADPDFTVREAANTTGWVDADLSPTDTISVPATNPYNEPILLTLVGFKRCRLVYTNATSTGTITAWVAAS
jgi:hypothetical protein